jgi:hypothetical protein
VQADTELLQVIRAARTTGGFTGCLHGRQEQADEHADDRDHHQELDEREAPSLGQRGRSHGYTFVMPNRAGNEKMNKSTEKVGSDSTGKEKEKFESPRQSVANFLVCP